MHYSFNLLGTASHQQPSIFASHSEGGWKTLVVEFVNTRNDNVLQPGVATRREIGRADQRVKLAATQDHDAVSLINMEPSITRCIPDGKQDL